MSLVGLEPTTSCFHISGYTNLEHASQKTEPDARSICNQRIFETG